MIQIPNLLRSNAGQVFGEAGLQWLDRLPGLFDQCVERWQLTDCRPSPAMYLNYVCFARSPAFGDVALKVGAPHPELFTEMRALSLYQGRRICAIHDSDLDLGALLLERIVPGHDLRTLEGRDEQVAIAVDLAASLPIPIDDGGGFPTYGQWVARAFASARNERRLGARMLGMIDAAEGWYAAIEADGGALMLLHGDLHHLNILQDQHGRWKAIDPKGVVGPRCIEPARFIENHVERYDAVDSPDGLDNVMAAFSAKLGVPKELIARCAFVDMVLSTCWSAEDHAPPDRLKQRIDECALFMQYANSL